MHEFIFQNKDTQSVRDKRSWINL